MNQFSGNRYRVDKQHDLELILRSRVPIIVIETHDEARMLDLLKTIAVSSGADAYFPLFHWSITDGLQRLDISLEPQLHNSDPSEVLKHIKAVNKPGIYVLLDFHPYLDDPVNVRLLKDICIRYGEVARQIMLVSHNVKLPRELESFSARFTSHCRPKLSARTSSKTLPGNMRPKIPDCRSRSIRRPTTC